MNPEPGTVYRLREGRGLPIRWRVQTVDGSLVYLDRDGQRHKYKVIKLSTLRKDYEPVKAA